MAGADVEDTPATCADLFCGGAERTNGSDKPPGRRGRSTEGCSGPASFSARRRQGPSVGTDIVGPSGNRARDCAVINWYCERAAQEGLQARSVRAIFEEGDPIFEASAIRTLSHVQITVRDPSVILEMEELRW